MSACACMVAARCEVLEHHAMMTALPAGSLYRQVALDACRDAIDANVRNWARAFIRGLRDLGYASNYL